MVTLRSSAFSIICKPSARPLWHGQVPDWPESPAGALSIGLSLLGGGEEALSKDCRRVSQVKAVGSTDISQRSLESESSSLNQDG